MTLKNTDIVYSDVTDDFSVHPIKQDLVRVVNELDVKQSIRRLILTRRTERFFNPLLGCGLESYLFEPLTPITAISIQSEIIQIINNFEPRARLMSVIVTPLYDQNSFLVQVTFYIINNSQPVSLTVTLERVR